MSAIVADYMPVWLREENKWDERRSAGDAKFEGKESPRDFISRCIDNTLSVQRRRLECNFKSGSRRALSAKSVSFWSLHQAPGGDGTHDETLISCRQWRSHAADYHIRREPQVKRETWKKNKKKHLYKVKSSLISNFYSNQNLKYNYLQYTINYICPCI